MNINRKHSTYNANEYKRCMGSQSPLPIDAAFWWIFLSSHFKSRGGTGRTALETLSLKVDGNEK
jgi:hypothetical protein